MNENINIIEKGTTVESSAEEEVKKNYEKLGIDLAQDHPKIFARLVEMHQEPESHFADAIAMAEMIDEIWDKMDFGETDKEKMMLCALLHDIGKSGPDNASTQARQVVRKLFSKTFAMKDGSTKVDVRDLSIEELINQAELGDETEIKTIVTEELKIDPAETTMREFWNLHVDWTYDILKNNMSGEIDQEVVEITASHHILDGKNPANLPEEEISPSSQVIELIEKYQFLTLIDKYQAFVERGGLAHQAAIAALRKLVTQSQVKEATKVKYLNLLDKFSQPGFEEIIQQKTE